MSEVNSHQSPGEHTTSSTNEPLFWRLMRNQLIYFSFVGGIGSAGGAIVVMLDLLAGGFFLKQTVWQNLSFLVLMLFQFACFRMAYTCLRRRLDRSGGLCFVLGLTPPVLYAVVDLLK